MINPLKFEVEVEEEDLRKFAHTLYTQGAIEPHEIHMLDVVFTEFFYVDDCDLRQKVHVRRL